MAYTIDRYNNTTHGGAADISVADNTLNETTNLKLVGKDWVGYGQTIAQNSVSLLENFASETEPTRPTEGQLWWNPETKILSVRSTNKWLGMDAGSSFATIKATDNTDKNVFITRSNGVVVSITSSYEDFIINTSETVIEPLFRDNGDPSVAGPATIKAGINMTTDTSNANKSYLFRGTATHAQYADVAEMYTSDAQHEPGTVIMFSDDSVEGHKGEEVCATLHEKDPKMLGVVTTDPALLMNSALQAPEGLFTVGVALLGRVPCKVTGIVNKGDRLVSSNVPGHAMAGKNDIRWTHVVGRALEKKNTEGEGVIEVIVGVK
tara:strand:- start:77 stop:1039 length:963 start_codon:yes stop_codon:yes gene_type:complete